MKKINLKTVKNSLKRDEMRNVKGGSGWGCLSSCSNNIHCAMTGNCPICYNGYCVTSIR